MLPIPALASSSNTDLFKPFATNVNKRKPQHPEIYINKMSDRRFLNTSLFYEAAGFLQLTEIGLNYSFEALGLGNSMATSNASIKKDHNDTSHFWGVILSSFFFTV